MGQQINTDNVIEQFFSNTQVSEALANLGMPDSIALSPGSFSSLGTAMCHESINNLEVLQKRYAGVFDSLLQLTAIRLIYSFQEWAKFCNSRYGIQYEKPLQWLDLGKDYEHAWIFSQHLRQQNFATQFLIPHEDWMSFAALLWLANASSLIKSGDVQSALNWIYVGQHALAIEGEFHTEILKDYELSQQRSEAGRKAAPSRHKDSYELKAWVDQQPEATPVRLKPTARARLLFKKMPKNFSNELDDPERVIRDHLLKNEKLRLASQP